MAEVAMLSCWRLQEQIDEIGRGMEEDAVTTAAGMSSCGGGAVDDATRGGGRATRSIVVATEDNDDGWDLPPLPARRRQMRQCRCPLRPTMETTKTRVRDDTTRRERGGEATTRDESGRWMTQGEIVESDEDMTRWRWTATEVRGEEAAGGVLQVV